jgi:hypothetical protein
MCRAHSRRHVHGMWRAVSDTAWHVPFRHVCDGVWRRCR